MKRNLLLTFILCAGCLLPSFGQRQSTLLDHKDRIRLKKMDVLNSAFRETNLSITPDGRYLFFVSFRGGQPWSNKYMTWRGDSIFDGDIWYSEKVSGTWRLPKVMPYGINTYSGEDEPNISPDGNTVYFQSWMQFWRLNGGPYYKVDRTADGWGKPEGLGGGINKFFLSGVPATDGMSISADGRTFVVVAGMDYDDANMDIYLSRKTSQGWSYCRRLEVSTPGDERSVFLAADGKTLYFASDGYKGFGGLDIFKATLNPDGSVGEVINVGAPFNTAQDDYGFILTADGQEAYFVRDGDIFFADLSDADERIKPGVNSDNVAPKIVLAGTVKDKASWKGIQAQIVLLDAQTKMPVKSIYTDKAGNYRIPLPNREKSYIQIVNRSGYLKITREVQVAQASTDQTLEQNYLLEKEIQEAPEEVIAENPAPSPPPVKEDPAPQPVPEPVEEDPYDFKNVAQNHLILLLDVSESMNTDDRLPLLKASLKKLLSYMREEDRISLLIYSGEVKVVLENVSATENDAIGRQIENLTSGGSTLGQSGLKRAYEIAANHYVKNGNNRIIMATDGEFNVDQLYTLAEANARRKIVLSVFAFDDHNKAKLSRLASKGRGNYSRIMEDNVEEALLKEATAVRKK